MKELGELREVAIEQIAIDQLGDFEDSIEGNLESFVEEFGIKNHEWVAWNEYSFVVYNGKVNRFEIERFLNWLESTWRI